ncbi:MAG: hypothetical protein ABSB63_17350 [Spirochaetia bacterium]|jgi:hypothetical protein
MNALSILRTVASSPLPWVILAGLFVGAAAARASMPTRRRKDPDRARTRKWVVACVLFSIAIVVALLGVFIPGPSKIVDIRLAWAAGIAAVVTFGALRFRKALGIPVLVLLVASAVLLGLFFQSIRAFTGETEIASVRVISVASSSMRLEVSPRTGEPALLTMDGAYFAPIVKVVIFDDLLVFLGARTWYRFEGMTSFDMNLRQGNTDFRFPRPSGISEQLWALFEQNEARIPGVKTVQIEMPSKRAAEFATYGIMVQNDGGVQVVPKSG